MSQEYVPLRTKEKLAIVGFAGTKGIAPFGNSDYEIWGLNQLYSEIPIQNFSRWFEIHGRNKLMPEGNKDIRERDPNYFEWLKTCPIPVYMHEHYDDIANSVKYPLGYVLERFKRRYYTNSIAYMLVLGIVEGFRHIEIYGVDMAVGGEYEKERPGVEYWIGYAEGMGINVEIAEGSDLCRFGYLYGFEDNSAFLQKLGAKEVEVRQRMEKYRMQKEEGIIAESQLIGALQIIEYFKRAWV